MTTSNLAKIVAAVLTAFCLTACSPSTQNMTIPTIEKIDINEAAETLGITVNDFEAFLDSLGTTYDKYVETLNKNNQSFDEIKKNVEQSYNCTFKNYVDTIVTVNNKNTPTTDKYVSYKSKYSVYDAYFPADVIENNVIKSCDIAIEIADDADDVVAFDAMQLCSGDTRLYFDTLTEKYACDHIEITNFTILGGFGVTKPSENNPCMDMFFVYRDETGEILDKITLSMLTLCYDDVNKNITLALSNELGLLFKTTGADGKENMLKLKDVELQIRKVQS